MSNEFKGKLLGKIRTKFQTLTYRNLFNLFTCFVIVFFTVETVVHFRITYYWIVIVDSFMKKKSSTRREMYEMQSLHKHFI